MDSVLKIGDTREFCIFPAKKPSEVLFGIIMNIDKEHKQVTFQRVHNMGYKNGKRVLKYLDEFYIMNHRYIRGKIDKRSWL